MSKTKSIAFLCHPYHRGGVTRWMADAAIALAAEGKEVYFLTVAPEQEFFSAGGRETMLQLLAKDNTNRIKIIISKAGYEFEFGTGEYRAHVYKQLVRQLPVGTPIILSDSVDTWGAATAYSRSYRIVGVLHADEAHYYDLAVRYAGQVSILACVSERISRMIKEKLPGFDAERIYTIPCGIELSATSASVYTDDGILKLVYAGRISDYQKRTGDLQLIAAQLAAKKIKFHLDIIGDGGEARKTLEAKVKDSGLSEQVTFRGWLSQQEVAGYFAQSDMLVLTSDFEGTPIAMMEALAAGCGVAGTRVSGIEDYEHHALAANCYRVYEVGDIAAVSCIMQLAAVPKDERRAAARQLAASEFSMEVCLQRYLAAINKVPVHMEQPEPAPLPLKALLYSRLIAFARYQKMKLKSRG